MQVLIYSVSAIYFWALIGYKNSIIEAVLVAMTQLLYYAHNILLLLKEMKLGDIQSIGNYLNSVWN